MTFRQRLILPTAVLASITLLLAFGFAHPLFVESFVDSDKFLPADWTQHVFHDGYPISGFQLPRTPSIFPDLLLYVPIQIAAGSWRAATAGVALAFLIALIGAAGVIVSRIAKVSVSKGVAASWIVVFPLLLVELAHSGWGRHFMVIQAVSHGGAFVVSLWAAAMADDLRRAPNLPLAILLCAICSVTVLSDKLFVFSFIIPLVAAALVVPAKAGARWSLLSVAVAATAIGLIADLFLHKQPDITLDWAAIPQRMVLFLGEINASIFLGTFVPVLLLLAAPIISRHYAASLYRSDRARFYWIVAVVSILGTMALTAAFLYEDRANYRYLYCAIWWPTIFAAAVLAVWLDRWHLVTTGLVVIIAAVACGMVLVSGIAPEGSLWRWQHPVARCLNARSDFAQFREGLAEYWQARPIELTSATRLQVDPLHRDGGISYWGNDLHSFSTSHFDRSRPPDYRFIVMTSLDPAAIAARYGKPARTIDCGGSSVWLYNHRLTVTVPPELLK